MFLYSPLHTVVAQNKCLHTKKKTIVISAEMTKLCETHGEHTTSKVCEKTAGY